MDAALRDAMSLVAVSRAVAASPPVHMPPALFERGPELGVDDELQARTIE